MARLTDEIVEDVLRGVREGKPVAPCVERHGLTRQVWYMRRLRDPEFDATCLAAEAEGHLLYWGLLMKALREGSKTWTGYATVLQRRYGFIDAVDEAKVRAINASAADELAKQRKIREFVEKARSESEGSPTAQPDDKLEGDGAE